MFIRPPGGNADIQSAQSQRVEPFLRFLLGAGQRNFGQISSAQHHIVLICKVRHALEAFFKPRMILPFGKGQIERKGAGLGAVRGQIADIHG
jgi:hypothetical protein